MHLFKTYLVKIIRFTIQALQYRRAPPGTVSRVYLHWEKYVVVNIGIGLWYRTLERSDF